MNKQAFLDALNSTLQQLTADERHDILEDFEEHFAMGLEEGKTEAEIADSLGSPQQIGKELLASYHIEKVETTSSAGNMFRAVWAVIGLGFFNLVIVLGPFIGLVGILFAGWVVGIVFAASPLLVLANTVVFPSVFEWFDLFTSLVLSGLGLFIIIGMFNATHAMRSMFVRYLKFNARMVKGGVKHA